MLSELRFATRCLLRWRGGAIAAALTLAIGIGTSTSLYALVRVMLADLRGVPDPDRLARIYASSQSLGVERSPVALSEFDTSLSRTRSFAAIGGYADEDATIGSAGDVRPVIAGYASPGFFVAMGVPPAAGRVFNQVDLDSSQPLVMLSDGLWRKEFPAGGLDNARIVVDGVERSVIGVMPPEFHYGFAGIGADLWIPLAHAGPNVPAIVTVYGRLREGLDWTAASVELTALSGGHEPWAWRAIPIAADARHRAVGAYAGTLGPAVLILLIACVNIACLLMARGIERDRELSVRRALGATRLRVIRSLLAENLVLALIGGALGGGLAIALVRALGVALGAVQSSLGALAAADIRLLPVAVMTSATACVLFGTAPALRLSRRDVAASLNGVPPAHRIQIAGYGGRDIVVFTEIASAVGLIVWTAMLYTLFAQIAAIRFAFPAERVVAMRVPARGARDVASRVAAVPGVVHAAVASGTLGGGSRVRVESERMRSAVMSSIPVGDGFLETLGVPLIRGRSFDAAEVRERRNIAILSESGARRLTPDGDALGLRVQVSGRKDMLVIGICRDAIDYGALTKAEAYAPPEIYVPYAPVASEAVVLARLSNDPHAALRAIAAAAETPPGARPARPVVLSDELKTRGADGGMVVTKILGSFALVTLLLAASGVFAVISQSMAQRTREFGIRLALGAGPRRLLLMVLAREVKLIGLAIGTGVVFSMALTFAFFVEVTRVNALVPWIWMAALASSGAVAAIACALATYRIVRLEPAAILRRS
jgi:putative ABC transport system permease protein